MRIWLLVLLSVTLTSPALAGSHLSARFALHVKPPFTPTKDMGLCGPGSYDPNAESLPCGDYTLHRSTLLEWPGPIVYLVVGRGDPVGINWASCGIDYEGGPGVGIDPNWVTWTRCTDGLQWTSVGPNGDWPNPGAGIRVSWTTCQNQDILPDGVHAVLGSFSVYVYSEAVMEVTPNNNLESGPELAVADCGASLTDLLQVSPPSQQAYLFPKVQFGGQDPLWNPCWGVPLGVPTLPTTWGRIKRQYGP